MRVQERDQKILRCCYEQQFLMMEHVERYFFKVGAWRRAYERVRELKCAGFITKAGELESKAIFRLTKKGLLEAKRIHPFEIPQAKRLDYKTIQHDAIVTSVALRLSDLWDGVWVPERALKKEDYAQVPDGVFVFDSANKVAANKIAIEVENSLKGRARFLSILDKWRNLEMKLVLYVATDPIIFKSLKRYLMDGPGGIPFGLVEWDALRDGTPTVWCPKGELEIFNRRTL